MKNTKRVDKKLFIDTHYLGKPAEISDSIVQRRISLIKKIPDFVGKSNTLLDIGCGNGGSMFLLANSMKSCTGIDIHSEYEQSIVNHLQHLNMTNCSFVCHDIESGTINGQYNRIISFEVLEHLKREKSIKNYYLQLSKNGLVAITVPNKWWVFETHGAKLPYIPWNRVPFFSWLPTKVHDKYANARIYTKRKVIKLLTQQGFKIIETKYITAPLDVLRKGYLKRILKKTIFHNSTTRIPFLATSILIVAKK